MKKSDPIDFDAMRRATPARLGVGRAGSRYTTSAMLSLRADHARAVDAVMTEVPHDWPRFHHRCRASRLRATWLADCGELLGLATFMAAAGISCSQRLGDLVACLEPAGEADAVRLLGTARRP